MLSIVALLLLALSSKSPLLTPFFGRMIMS